MDKNKRPKLRESERRREIIQGNKEAGKRRGRGEREKEQKGERKGKRRIKLERE